MSSLRVVQVTDTHVTPRDDAPTVLELLADIDGGDPMSHLAEIVEDIAGLTRRPDRIVGTGDLADTGHPDSYLRWRRLFAPLGIETHVVPGNHDLADAFDEHLLGGFASSPMFSEDGDWLFLYVRTGNTEWGEIEAQHAAELRRLRAASNASNVFVWIHHPPVAQYIEAHNELIRDDLRALLDGDPRVRGIAAGHMHVDRQHDFDGIPVYLTPATYTGRPKPGYRVFDFEADGTVNTSVRTIEPHWTMSEPDRKRLFAMAKERFALHAKALRNYESRARAEVEEWQSESLARKARRSSGRG